MLGKLMRLFIILIVTVSVVQYFVNAQCLTENDSLRQKQQEPVSSTTTSTISSINNDEDGDDDDDDRNNEDNDYDDETKQHQHQLLYTNGQLQFSLQLLQHLNQLTPDQTIFFSPYSIYHALLLAYFIARNQTEQNIHKVLHLPSNYNKIDTFDKYNFEKYIRSISTNGRDTSYVFNTANKIYVAKSLNVRDCVKQLLADEVNTIDFQTDPQLARTTINNWVSNVTSNQINDLLSADEIDSNTKLVLANAAYFNGMWKSKFPIDSTNKTAFFVTGSEIRMVDMMYQQGTFNIDASDDLGAHILELPYVGDDVSMFIFLPPFASVNNGVENVLAKINATYLNKLVRRNLLFPRNTIVGLPKFNVEYTLELAPTLLKMGVGDLFDKTADLSVLTGENNIDLGRARHKAKLDVYEDGTSAAAATVLFSFRSRRPDEPATFICNHPFIYIIYDRISRSILFTGIYRRP